MGGIDGTCANGLPEALGIRAVLGNRFQRGDDHLRARVRGGRVVGGFLAECGSVRIDEVRSRRRDRVSPAYAPGGGLVLPVASTSPGRARAVRIPSPLTRGVEPSPAARIARRTSARAASVRLEDDDVRRLVSSHGSSAAAAPCGQSSLERHDLSAERGERLGEGVSVALPVRFGDDERRLGVELMRGERRQRSRGTPSYGESRT